ncbi:MAG: methyltransferase domain-containing protein [Chloroflexi bacterium]|nr:methyltransferase domain-containing protein [Chloroflexota bacterium]
MTIGLDELDYLSTAAGARLLAQLSTEDLSDANTLRLLTSLRRDLPAAVAGAALEMARLRSAAVGKFGADAGRMFFTRAALEQASDPLVRRYRAGSVGAGPQLQMTDVCCGIGSDALAFAAAGASVHGIDHDPVGVAIAAHNAAALGLSVTFEVADAHTITPQGDLLFYDPARRDSEGRRIHHVARYLPPLSLLRGWVVPQRLAKLSPGVDLAQLDEYGGAVEFISANGDLKEALLRLDANAAGAGQRRATLLTESATYHWQRDDRSAPAAPITAPRGWLVEPDPALIRAGLVADAAVAFGGALLDETIAYFTTDADPSSPWARAWPIEAWLPFNLKALRAYLRARDVGQVTVKKRGTAVTPDVLIQKLKLKGSDHRVVILTRNRGQQIVLICN